MGWGNIYRRRMRVFTVALIMYLDYKAVLQREKWISTPKQSALWEKAHERNAKRVFDLIIELEGLWVKLGQFMSTRGDILPRAYISLLKQLQDSLPPRPLQEVCETIQKELERSMDELFADFVKEPLATASIGQVHRATLLNGQEVAVKVQHEGIKTVILEDLKSAKSIVDWIAWADPQCDFNPIIDEWCKEAPKELDFNHEAENTRTVATNLGCRNKSDKNINERVDVLIPEVIQSTEKVLVLEYMDGIRLNDLESLEAFGVNKQKIVEEITRAYAHQIYVDGLFNADPHPGNFLVSKEAPHRPILLDFGLTKKLSSSLKQAFAKMFLASAEGDHVALLSSFAEMGLKLRLDMPDQAMKVTALFFCTTAPVNDSDKTMKSLGDQKTKDVKVKQENLNQKEVNRLNPIDAFPGAIITFGRVLTLLRGLSSTMKFRNRIVYQEVMRPFAESCLKGHIFRGPSVNDSWICDTPVHSDVEAKLRQLLVELGSNNKILGIQVCAYKDGEVIIDTAAGVLGKYDPRPVQPDSLFPVFSVTKGITAGMLHWLVDNGKLKFEENVVNIWPEFGSSGKDIIKVHHVLNHTSGLHNALAEIYRENPLLMYEWDECLHRICMSVPETKPGQEQLYHYLSFGWLCGGIIEVGSGKKFQEILEEALVRPLQIDGELYIGIPPGVESRLATLTVDTDDLNKLSGITNRPDLPSNFQPESISQLVTMLPVLFNLLNTRRAIIPAANGHCSARALARYYAALADGGRIPPPHSSHSKPQLGSHPHTPNFSSQEAPKKRRGGRKIFISSIMRTNDNDKPTYKKDSSGSPSRLPNDSSSNSNADCIIDIGPGSNYSGKIFGNQMIVDAFMGVGKYGNLTLPNGKFGLGFSRINSRDGSSVGFGHLGMGGSTGYCDVTNRFSISVTLNKMSLGSVTANIIQFVCSELNIPVPEDYSRFGETELNMGRALIN
ncbi:Beta-lactamase-related protein [Quillaja saponaria]|uniref:Beta-lactamase-related protein n=1 Tax=Quillaja saponaria TaxID=32244 RepID=A0AAD7PK56_QUISA|nr:Beta-lactamase-related protein [Quillaja saponaria]